jgi:hypothetical protein
MWWQIPPSGKIFHSAVRRNLAEFAEFFGYRFFGMNPAEGNSNRAI